MFTRSRRDALSSQHSQQICRRNIRQQQGTSRTAKRNNIQLIGAGIPLCCCRSAPCIGLKERTERVRAYLHSNLTSCSRNATCIVQRIGDSKTLRIRYTSHSDRKIDSALRTLSLDIRKTSSSLRVENMWHDLVKRNRPSSLERFYFSRYLDSTCPRCPSGEQHLTRVVIFSVERVSRGVLYDIASQAVALGWPDALGWKRPAL